MKKSGKKLFWQFIVPMAAVIIFALSNQSGAGGSRQESAAPTAKEIEPIDILRERARKIKEERERASKEPDPYNVALEPVDSSAFSEVGYDNWDELLVVRFRNSGIRYCYYDVPWDEWDSFYSSDSLGKYFNEHIKGYYEYLRMD